MDWRKAPGRCNDFLAGLPMTVLAGVFLAASFVLPYMGVEQGSVLAWPCIVICGYPLLYLSVWRIVYNKGIAKISSALLITIAMFAAIYIGDVFAAGEVGFIMEIGALLEDYTTKRAWKGLNDLVQLVPERAVLVKDGKETEVPVSEISVGDVVRVRPGQTIPVDGMVIVGETSVNQSALTGENLPVDKVPGDAVMSGSINTDGSIDVLVEKTGEDSSVQRLVRLVKEADNNQAPTQRIADRWASWLVPIAASIAVIAALVTGDVVRGVTVLVVFCPCALVLSTPTAIVAAIGQSTKHGVLIKNGAALEEMGSAKTVAFDKTGTLTYGAVEVSDVLSFGKTGETEVLEIAASAEFRSEHPLSRAIVSHAREKGLKITDPERFQSLPGRGVGATVDGRQYIIGSLGFMDASGVEVTDSQNDDLKSLSSQGKAVVLVAGNGELIGAIGLSDRLRPECRQVMGRLGEMGVKAAMLTGDRSESARFMAAEAGIDVVCSDLLPEGKIDAVNGLKTEGKVCMVGDGINDAPALKSADIGVAMGAMGTGLAVESADVVLMTDDITRIPYLLWLSSLTVRTIKTAITLSMCINFVAVSASVLGLLTPTTGALVHNAGSCFVVLLAALLYDRKYPHESDFHRKDGPVRLQASGPSSVSSV
ncbi:MAG: cation-translocating P-type ATPase [Candidatus Methanomethylophilaceae archaeon]|nr:cation-translocating P-type ATPase [Candidatus Methanomethylophilaceae archaeon]